ncbi:hypothetical protein BpHYR1_017938 [Brachionus plicatilis]|uniref:Uncharacterized protein n=1 Tax=Brachionus plicatilis TaxID=10195 RepID=A0A3M7Q0H5_BRAPC|nr:hypothetical protein BpHYR1_017938 [Brachionus plicatilis]
MLSNRNLNDVTPVTTTQAQTQRFQLSGRYPRPQALVQNTRPRPQPVVNNKDSQENTAFRFFSFFTHRINSKIGRINIS